MKTKENAVKTVKYQEVSPSLPTKYGYVQYVVRPIRIVDGCVTTLRE